jgi:hypothetical protein
VIKLGAAQFILAGAVLASAGCTPPGAPFRAKTTTWVNCKDFMRDAVSGPRVRVQICAASGARFLDGSNAGAGARVARMVNAGPGVERRWELLPGEEYTINISQGAAGQGGRFQVVGPGNVQNQHRRGEYFQCTPHRGVPAGDSAKFGGCDINHTRAHGMPESQVAARGPSEGTSAALGIFDGPAWITCQTGCCTTEAQ